MHRDIKPENLLLDKEGRVKIADFGIAKMLGTDADTAVRDEGQQAGTLASAAGTPQYMAPEQKAHRITDHRADIYSLGVVLYELLTGELPADKLQPPSRKVQIDVRLDEIVLRALEAQPELRYQTAREFRTQLETAVSTHAGSQSSRLFKTGQGFLFPPDQFTTASGQFFACRTRGQLILDDRQLTHSRAGVNTIIPLAAIRDVSLGQYPRTLQPSGVDLLSVTYEEGGQRRQILLSPMEGWFGFPSDRNALTAEWFAALRDAVTSATGHEPASTPREQLGIPRGSHLTLALMLSGPLFALAVLAGCLIYLAIMRQTPGTPTTFPFNINPLGVIFALFFLFGLIAFGLPWLVQRRTRNASSSAASLNAPGAASARRKQIVFACVAVLFIILSLLGERYFNWRWEKTHWHTLRMAWSDRTNDVAGALRIAEVTREGRIVIFRIACESGPMPVDFQVSYSGQELDSLPSADTVPSVTALYAPLPPQIASVGIPVRSGMTLLGTRWVRRMEKITRQKPGEVTLGFVLPDEARAERAMQEARRIYLPERPCHLQNSDVLMLFTEFRNVGENNWEQSQAMLNVDFAAAPSQPAPATSSILAPTFGPVKAPSQGPSLPTPSTYEPPHETARTSQPPAWKEEDIVVELYFGAEAQPKAPKHPKYTKLVQALNSLKGVVTNFPNAGADDGGIITSAIIRDLSQRCLRETQRTQKESELRVAIDSALKDADIETVLWHEDPEETETPKTQDSESLPADNGITAISWSGPQGTVLSMAGMELDIDSKAACFGVVRYPDEIRRIGLFVEYAPLLQGAALAGRLDVYPRDSNTARFLQANAVPLTITKEDLRAAWDDDLVKVFYLPHPTAGRKSPSPVEVVDSTHRDPEGDKHAIEQARQSGAILAVLRLGKDFKTLGIPAPDASPVIVPRPSSSSPPPTDVESEL
ncbi:MAG: serine/threonine-protein kinase [Planctomycetota bacterium]|nr:serine/threonine-protein kinase [Planctomycetota bacterium]